MGGDKDGQNNKKKLQKSLGSKPRVKFSFSINCFLNENDFNSALLCTITFTSICSSCNPKIPFVLIVNL